MISWIAFTLAIIGAYLCARERKVAFKWLGISNLIWVGVGLYFHQWALASQQAIFFGFAIYSYRQWSLKSKKKLWGDWIDDEYLSKLRQPVDPVQFEREYLGTFPVVKPDFVEGEHGHDRIGDGTSGPWHCTCSWSSKLHGDVCPEHGTPAKVYAGHTIRDNKMLGGGNVQRPLRMTDDNGKWTRQCPL
jgi:hypothetical protein